VHAPSRRRLAQEAMRRGLRRASGGTPPRVPRAEKPPRGRTIVRDRQLSYVAAGHALIANWAGPRVPPSLPPFPSQLTPPSNQHDGVRPEPPPDPVPVTISFALALGASFAVSGRPPSISCPLAGSAPINPAPAINQTPPCHPTQPTERLPPRPSRLAHQTYPSHEPIRPLILRRNPQPCEG